MLASPEGGTPPALPLFADRRNAGGQLQPPATSLQATYRQLMRMPGFGTLSASLLVLRSADIIWDDVVLALFALQHFGLAAAPVAALCYEAPPVFLGPLAGAALDRFGRKRMVVVYCVLASVMFGAIGTLGMLGHLSLPVFYTLVVIATIGVHFSQIGLRTLIPVLVDWRLWDRANGVDTATFVASELIGPVIAAAAFAVVGGIGPVLVMAGMYAVAAVMTARLPRIRPFESKQTLLAASWTALRYTLANPTLRGLILVTWVFNFTYGFLSIAVGVLVTDRLGLRGEWVGYLWAISGLAGIVASLVAGRVSRDGRERSLVAFGCLTAACGVVMAGSTDSLVVVLAGMVLIGVATGPFDVALFSLRLRRTRPEWVSRVVSVSDGLNNVGSLSGASVAGLLLVGGVSTGFALCGLVSLLGSLVVFLAVPRHGEVFEYGRRPPERE